MPRPLLLACLPLLLAACAWRSRPPPASSRPEAKAVQFLQQQVPLWSRENGCYSCHNNGDAARALFKATRHGYSFPAEVLSDTLTWLQHPLRWDHNQGDPGYSDKRLADIQFSAALVTAFKVGLISSREPLFAATRRVAAGQQPDGSWDIEPHNPAGSPTTYGSALATLMAMLTLSEARDAGTDQAIQRGLAWLEKSPSATTPNLAAKLLATRLLTASSAAHKSSHLAASLLQIQNGDGGWGPYRDSPSEPFDTAIALLSLRRLSQTPTILASMQRGHGFLAARQNADGSWPATTRPPGGDSYAQRISTTAWVLMAFLGASE